MWIEVISDQICTMINTNHVSHIFYGSVGNDHQGIGVMNGEKHLWRYRTEDQKLAKAIYDGFQLALSGVPMTIGDTIHIRPLIKDQQEALYRRMLFAEIQADLAKID